MREDAETVWIARLSEDGSRISSGLGGPGLTARSDLAKALGKECLKRSECIGRIGSDCRR